MTGDVLGGNAQSQLRSIIERVERLEAEKAEIAAQIKEVFFEAKGNGFDVKILRRVVRIRKQDRAKRMEEEAILDLYLSALGEISDFERGAPEGGIATITLTSSSGASVTATPAMMQSALSSLKSDDELYADACNLVRESSKASASYIQRRLQLGYNKAASLVERMEREGIVSAADHAGKRQVLSTGEVPGG